jgi:putative transposase
LNRKEAVCNSPLSLSRSCRLLSISRSSLYYKPKNCGFSTEIKKQIDTIYLEDPTRGTRRISVALRNVGFDVGRFKIRRLMKNMGLSAIYCKPNLSKPHPQHKIYPYLLRGIKANKANHNLER